MNRHGFSYIEILVALAIFAIAAVAVLPILVQSGRNQNVAYVHYSAHLQAQHIMHEVRRLIDESVISPDAAALPDTLLQQVQNAVVHTESSFPVIYLVRGTTSTAVYGNGTPLRPFFLPAFDPGTFDFSAFAGRTGIIVFIFNEHGHIIARAIGVA